MRRLYFARWFTCIAFVNRTSIHPERTAETKLSVPQSVDMLALGLSGFRSRHACRRNHLGETYVSRKAETMHSPKGDISFKPVISLRNEPPAFVQMVDPYCMLRVSKFELSKPYGESIRESSINVPSHQLAASLEFAPDTAFALDTFLGETHSGGNGLRFG